MRIEIDIEDGGARLIRVRDAALREGIAHAEATGDYVSRELMADILESEEGHVDWLETQLDLIGRIGEPNYLLTKLDD